MPQFKKSNNSVPRGEKIYKRPQLNSYYRAKTSDEPVSPFKKKQVKGKHRKILFGTADVILVVLLLAGITYSLIVRPQPKIVASNSSYHSTSYYTSAIAPLFGGTGNRNKLTFNETSVSSAIENKFPEVQSVRIELPFFSQQPTVWLNISPPVFKLVSSNQAYIIDSQGVAVAKAEDLLALTNLVTLNDQSGFNNQVGKQVLSSSSVAFINSILAQSKKAKIPVSTLTLPPLAQEVDLRTADQPYYVKFYLGGDPMLQAGQFLASRQKFAQTNQNPSEYLDVRVSGKIFYK